MMIKLFDHETSIETRTVLMRAWPQQEGSGIVQKRMTAV